MFFALIASLTPAFAEPCGAYDLDAVADQAVTAVTDFELDRARELATAALSDLHCLERVADTEDLATLWQVLGAVGVFEGLPEVARPNLLQANGVYPGWFNERLGAEVRQAWQSAGSDGTGAALIRAWPIPDEGVLYVDGRPHEEQPAAVSPGQHLVQVSVGAEVQFARMLDMGDGQTAELDTGLEPPSKKGIITPTPWLIGSASAALLAGAGWTTAYLIDRKMPDAQEPQELESLRRASLATAGVSIGLAATVPVGLGLHLAFR